MVYADGMVYSIYMEEAKKKKIVLIEDEPTLINIMVSKLEKVGYEVKSSQNGVDGLALIRAEHPDLILLDIVLPGKDGLEILEELNKDGTLPKTPVIVISNSGQPVEIARILKMGVRDYLIKVNFSPTEVLNKVELVLASEERREAAEKKGGTVVLIVEDDVVLVDLLERKFHAEHYRVVRAVNVTEARRILAEQKVDGILLDIVLPDVGGFTFLKELKSQDKTKDIPVIIISNLGQREEVEKGMAGGALDYIVKANVLPKEIFEKADLLFKKKV